MGLCGANVHSRQRGGPTTSDKGETMQPKPLLEMFQRILDEHVDNPPDAEPPDTYGERWDDD